jgi:hypothetical protein
MTKIILTRHGHVEGIKPARFRGRTELPLTELGQAQAKAVAARIAKTWNPVKVYTSPMGRCVATGQEIARACRVGSEPIEALNDLDYGRWQWRTFDEVRGAIRCRTLWPGLPTRFASCWNATLPKRRPSSLSGTTASIEPCSCSFSINPSQRIGGSPRSHARSMRSTSLMAAFACNASMRLIT